MTLDKRKKVPVTVDLSAAFKKLLDTHGYGFHYAVLERCIQLKAENRSEWSFEVAELPVEVGDRETRIDFVLRTGSAVLVAECKRANPALARWCFARAPHLARRAQTGDVRLEQFYLEQGGRRLTTPVELADVNDQYQLAFEMRTGSVGDDKFTGRNAIDDAVTQAIRGANGLVNLVGRETTILNTVPTFVVPVVFTTAQLFVSEANLALSDPSTGETPASALETRDWLWYQHNISKSLEHRVVKVLKRELKTSLAQMLRFRSARSVAIVNPSAIEPFLKTLVTQLPQFHTPSPE